MKIVFIGEDNRTADIASLSIRLRWPGATLPYAATATEGLELVERDWPDMVLLHPDLSLTRAIHDLRDFSNGPLLVLGRQCDEMEAGSSLERGADDYVRLPCDLTELTTGIWALLRRASAATSHESERPTVSGRLLINPASYEAYMGGQGLALTTTEFRLLSLLLKNWGIVVSRQTLECTLWGDQTDSYGLVKNTFNICVRS